MIQLFLNIVISSSLFILIAYSFLIIYRTIHFFHISHAIIITLGAYFNFLFSIQLDIFFPVSIVLTIFFSTLVGLLISPLNYSNLNDDNTAKWKLLIVSLGIYIVLQNILSMYFGDEMRFFRIWKIKESYKIFDAYITDIQILTVIVSVFLLLTTYLLLEKTDVGKKIKAVSSNPCLSGILGISTDKSILYSVILGSILASVAGILIASDIGMTPTMGFNWLLYGVVTMILAGVGAIRYLIMSALLLATIQHLFTYFLGSEWMNATTYIVLITLLFFKPYGLGGNWLKKAEI